MRANPAGLGYAELARQAPPGELTVALSLPSDTVPVIVTLDGVPRLFVLCDDGIGRLGHVTHMRLCEEGLALIAWMNLYPGAAPACPPLSSPARGLTFAQVCELGGLLKVAQSLLMFVGDERMPLRRDKAATKQDAARLRWRVILPVWRLDARKAREYYPDRWGGSGWKSTRKD